MIVAGLQKTSLIDYPGKISSTIFLQGCNFRCPWCHNNSLIGLTANNPIPLNEVLNFLKGRIKLIQHVTITGGEPTINPTLPEFITKLKSIGLSVKLDTNGSKPMVLKRLLDANLLDYVAMDVKAPYEKYGSITGVRLAMDTIQSSMNVISDSCVAHHFRTTFVPHLLDTRDMEMIKSIIPPGSKHVVQKYIEPLQPLARL